MTYHLPIMKITILTPSFNQGSFIEKNIRSVTSQSYTNFEHIVIDGGSTDNTIEILKKYLHLKWVSEPDEGQADALNKGLAMATGDIIGWINSDDYYQKNIFHDVASHFKNPNIQWIIGDITHFYKEAGIKKAIKCQEITYTNLLKNPDIVKQQGVFFRKNLLDKVGGWNKDFHMIMDFDLWLRLSILHPPKMVHKNYAYFLWHDDQKSNPKNIVRQIKEINKLLLENKANPLDRYRMMLKKYYYLFKSFVKSWLISAGIINKKFSAIPISTFRKYK